MASESSAHFGGAYSSHSSVHPDGYYSSSDTRKNDGRQDDDDMEDDLGDVPRRANRRKRYGTSPLSASFPAVQPITDHVGQPSARFGYAYTAPLLRGSAMV
jgi:hypothetical protein